MKNILTYEEFVNESVNEGRWEELAKDVAELIGKKLDPMSFYEYLEDYSKDQPNGEYGFDEDQLTTLIIAFEEIEQEALGMTDLNTSKVKSSKLYKAYLKESVNEGQYDNVDIEDLHFETDPDILDDMKLSFGYKRGGITRKEKIENADYELKRFRKKIKYWDGNKRDEDWAVDVFVPNHYNAIKSTLGNGPHAKKIKPVKWNQKKYDKWIEDMASGGGANHAFDMAQNATMEPNLLDWVAKKNPGTDPLDRIQWDIEMYA
jgi:hypothetical protein